jgi:hypothetical protein
VSKLGDWTGPMKKIAYPVQVIDAVRDLVLNILYRLFWVHNNDYIHTFSMLFMPVVADVEHQRLEVRTSFADAGVTPTAWASRIARCKAIESAKSAVYIDAAVIACSLHLDKEKNFQPYLDQLNKDVGLTGNDKWDGILWPYDLIAALALFMETAPVKDGNGVYILLTSSDYKGDKEKKGWADLVAANEFKQRIRSFVFNLLDMSDTDYDKWFNERCQMKRITDDGSMMNHCKVICTDKKLLYVGSDNLYPNYNEEHGIWIDDTNTIEAWHKSYWTPRWAFAKEAKWTAGTKDFVATMVKPVKPVKPGK